jgi:Beta-ketoacyl synthase, N-terminal domain
MSPFESGKVDLAPSVLVGSVGVWLPGVPDLEHFKRGARGFEVKGTEYPPPGGKSIEARSRRRASRLSRAMADACAEAIVGAGLDAMQVPTVFGSALGEATTMISLLDQMWRGQEMSPMAFATSVHSAASGVVSISAQNRGFTTSLSADFDTASAALLEAWGLVQTMRTPVIVVCGDDDSPKDFVPDHEAFDLLAVAISLCPIDHVFAPGHHALGRLSWPIDAQLGLEQPRVSPLELTPRVSRNPQAALLDLVGAIIQGANGTVRLDRGRGSGQVISYTSAP